MSSVPQRRNDGNRNSETRSRMHWIRGPKTVAWHDAAEHDATVDDLDPTSRTRAIAVPSARERMGQYGRACDRWLSIVATRLALDERVSQLWTVGSLGRGGGDMSELVTSAPSTGPGRGIVS
jgi:hypothetical protein